MATHTGMPTSTANWHWKNKNVTPWARKWFEQQLVAISVSGDADEGSVSITELTDMDGDVELGQRKSKLITIYDCKIELKWTGMTADGVEVSGSLTIPEVSHEITIDGMNDYEYSWSLSNPISKTVDAVYNLAKKRLPEALEAKFAEFPSVLIETHGKDLTVTGSQHPSRQGTPAPVGPTVQTSANAAKPGESKQASKTVNTRTVNVEARFMASADDLFGLLTDEKRIPMWSRAPATSNPQINGAYSLFGGGIRGKYTTLNPPKTIVQTWALQSPTWPSGHEGTLTLTLDQSSDSTLLKLSLVGVPIGMEDEIKGNMEGYYIHGLKSIGYVHLIQPPTPARSEAASSRRDIPNPGATRPYVTILFGILIVVAAVAVPFLSQK